MTARTPYKRERDGPTTLPRYRARQNTRAIILVPALYALYAVYISSVPRWSPLVAP